VPGSRHGAPSFRARAWLRVPNLRCFPFLLLSRRELGVDGNADLRHFQHYRPHLAFVQQQMAQWKPRNFSELFTATYHDRLTWFTAVFGVAIGILGALSLVTSFVQMIVALVAL
jgi:hypothetical protein